MSCACPGRLEVSRGIVEAKHVTSGRHPSSVVDLTNTNSCQLKSTHMTPTNCSRITSPAPSLWDGSADAAEVVQTARASMFCSKYTMVFMTTFAGADCAFNIAKYLINVAENSFTG